MVLGDALFFTSWFRSRALFGVELVFRFFLSIFEFAFCIWLCALMNPGYIYIYI